jgi:DEAD/DEAH box helicase domain-containing protein
LTIETLLKSLREDVQFIRNITAWKTMPAQIADRVPWPATLEPCLVKAGQALGISNLYVHQARAIEAALEGENVVLATGTASGKTLGYILPVFQALIRDPQATALFLFPTKALAHDQMAAIERWVRALKAPGLIGKRISVRPYDGDTPRSHRAAIRKEARILVSNPDMLHLGILPHHTRWMRFFQGLRYVVLDELHTYRGIFGSHVVNVLRRLRRIARFYGADPQFVVASATIANPRELAESLWEAPVLAVEEDGAAYGQRHVLFYNPPLLNPTLGLRASATAEAVILALRLLRAQVQTIIFARSRLTVELLLRQLRERVSQLGFPPDIVQGYRGGYLAHERRAIERGLREGDVRLVIATNALELGIDIGALDASLLVGYPGSIAAARQQMGRAGRRAKASLAVLIATPSPLDQYLVTHPEYFFHRSAEEARVNANTLSLLASHLACAAFELPIEPREPFGGLPNAYRDADHSDHQAAVDLYALLDVLCSEGVLHRGDVPDSRSQERFTWVGETYPAQSVSLRSATPDNVIVQAVDNDWTGDESDERGLIGAAVIGVIDRPSAPRLVHKGAVYFHAGKPYVVEALDWEQGVALTRSVDVNYYTAASETTKVERLVVHRCVSEHIPDLESKSGLGSKSGLEAGYSDQTAFVITDEEVVVHSKATAYRRVHLTTHETLGWGEIDLPEQILETQAFRLTLGFPLVEALAQQGTMVLPLDYGPEWPHIREDVLERDNHACRLCGASGRPDDHEEIGFRLEVHHLTPLRNFLAQYPRSVALRLAHAPENLLTLCTTCHQRVEHVRGARTALSGIAYLLRNLAPVFLMCDPRDLGTSIGNMISAEGPGAERRLPSVVVYELVPGGVGLAPRLLDLWPKLAEAMLDRVETCACMHGCPSCVGPAGESEMGAKEAARQLLTFVVRKVPFRD